MKKILVVFAVLILAGICSSTLSASDWGCKCILCLSNPGGATQYGECKPPIHKLERHLENGGSFPSCNEAEAQGYHVKEGIEGRYTCEEAYGEGWESAWREVDVGGENTRIERQEYCRKLEGYKVVQQCDGETESGEPYGCKDLQRPYYSESPLKRRSAPYYIELYSLDGQPLGERVWYKKKKKKGGLF